MDKAGTITMTMRALDRMKVIQALVDGNLKPNLAAGRLGLTVRQVRRLANRYREEGPSGLVSRRCNRPSNNHKVAGISGLALSVIRERYADFGPTFACEKLREGHGLLLSKETVHKLMMNAGLWIPRRLRTSKIYQPRNRRHCLGELVQIDGSDHAWFEDRGPPCTLLVYIDDATSRLMHLHFTYSESTFSYFEATRGYLESHGKPQAFYSDQATVFRISRKGATGGVGHTQFGRAMFELNIEGICANSSQAKGRVERANATLQDRLIKEMRLLGISTMAAANAYAPAFMADFNARFAKPPRNDFDANRPLREDEDLTLIFSVREPRRVTHSLTLQYDRIMYLLTDTPTNRALIGKYVEVYEYPDGRIEPRANGAALTHTIYDRLSEVDQGAVVENKRLGHVLQIAHLVQQQRDNRRILTAPATTNQGRPTKQKKMLVGKKSQRALDAGDVAIAIAQTALEPVTVLERRSP